MRKTTIAGMIAVLVLATGADCRGSRPNPRNPSPEPANKWVCSTAPVDCPVQPGRQPAPTP
jgi:hypothetical protein